MIKTKNNRFLNWLFFIIWFVFIPNSAYVITDLMHLKEIENTYLWIDSLLIFNFAMNSLFIGSISLELIFNNFLLPRLGLTKSWIVTLILIYFTSIGIYMGRFLRFNSWDFITNPSAIFRLTVERYTNPGLHPIALPFSIFISTTILINFILVKNILKR